jgi:hypothetical protein
MCKKIYKINKKRIKVKQINKRLSISLSLLSGALIGGGIVGLIMGLRQCSKNSTALCLSTLINDKIRYQFIDEPTDADLYGEINRMNDYRFFVGELEFNRNTPFESITINSVDEKQYRGEVTIHYDVSPYISLSE